VKRVAKWVGIVFALLILIVVGLPFLINVDQTLQSDLSEPLQPEIARVRSSSGDWNVSSLGGKSAA
jgi:hypothetical protein